MATQPYGLLVEENDDEIGNEVVKSYSEASTSQVDRTHPHKEVRDSDITVYSISPPPYSLEEEEDGCGEKSLEDIRNHDIPAVETR